MSEHKEAHEALVDRYIAENNTQSAVALLFELIVLCAKEKNFPRAEALRTRLFEVDALALSEIVKSGELIEEEKRAAISSNHLSTWADLYSRLTQEETNALYYAFRKVRFDVDAPVFRQGAFAPRLYFINAGKAKLTCMDNNRETLLQRVGPGDVVGEMSFFSNTICTRTLTALSPLEIQYLDKAVLKSWQDSLPALEEKLHAYCLAKKRDAEKIAEPNRREHQRFRLSGAVSFQLLNAQGVLIGNDFGGELSDISQCGLSFHLKITVRDDARMLLGRMLGMKLTIPAGDAVLTGSVVAVHAHPLEDYAVHVRFHKLLPEQSLSSLPPIQ